MASSAAAAGGQAAALTRCDLLVRGATVVDGTGAPGYRADVAVCGDRVAAIGALGHVRAEEIVAGDGRIVCPGFVDIHTHDDRALLDDPAMTAKVSQGVATVVTGNCGISLAPVPPPQALPATFELLGDAAGFRYPAFADYLAAVDARPAAVNAACLVGHSTLRLAAVPDLQRAATDAEIARMQALLADALAAGAAGFSSGLYYPVSRAAPTEEVIALGRVMQAHGGLYATHMRDEGDGVEDAIAETLQIGRDAGVPVLISHHKVIGPRNFGRSVRTLRQIEEAMRTQRVALDMYPYVAGSTVLAPERCDGSMRVMLTWSKPHPQFAGRTIDDIAAEWGCPGREAAERLLPAGAIYFMLDEADVRRILSFPHTMIGSDGLPHDRHPHPRLWGAFPRVLGHYARDLGLLTMEDAVRRMTSLPAACLGLADRGTLRPGAYADLVVFDPATVIDRATFDRPAVPSAGILLTCVNGNVVWRDGAVTGTRPGRVLRRRPA